MDRSRTAFNISVRCYYLFDKLVFSDIATMVFGSLFFISCAIGFCDKDEVKSRGIKNKNTNNI